MCVCLCMCVCVFVRLCAPRSTVSKSCGLNFVSFFVRCCLPCCLTLGPDTIPVGQEDGAYLILLSRLADVCTAIQVCVGYLCQCPSPSLSALFTFALFPIPFLSSLSLSLFFHLSPLCLSVCLSLLVCQFPPFSLSFRHKRRRTHPCCRSHRPRTAFSLSCSRDGMVTTTASPS